MRRTSLLLACMALLGAISACDRGSRPAQIGKAAPDFTITDSERTVTLSKLRGKPVLLNFWASWCGPCLQEIPSLIALHKQLGDKVTILGVSIDEDEGEYRKFLRDHNIEFMTVRDPKQMSPKLYGTFGWPETYVIDADGVIRRKFIGPAEWTSHDIVQFIAALEPRGTAPANTASK